ncbi:hypothetical protein Q4595_15860 [Wenyingzhuangia sp. 1_MG-2023]|nr:hypothetical protein [Wenyingzhuangia sp. 1_MG-2023]
MVQLIFIFIVLEILFLIPSYFLYRKYLKRKSVIKNLKIYSFLATLLMPIIWTTLFTVICYGIINPILRSKDFNEKLWKEDIYSRYKMKNDLSHKIIGKTKNEVIELLGNDYKSNCLYVNTICYVAYEPDNLAILDHYEIVIHFDENDIVNNISRELI